MLSLTALSLAVAPTAAPAACTSDAVLVFDASGSMGLQGFDVRGAPRIADARKAMHRAVPLVADLRPLGLVIYGPGAREGCAGIDTVLWPRAGAAAQVLGAIDAVEPGGKTPLTEAVGQAAAMLGEVTEPGVIVLVTDGRESCGGRPCVLASDLAATSPHLTVHVVGFRETADLIDYLGEEVGDAVDANATACLADETGGTYTSTETVDELVTALDEVLGCAQVGRLPVAPA